VEGVGARRYRSQSISVRRLLSKRDSNAETQRGIEN
jgi:hypothetical protein